MTTMSGTPDIMTVSGRFISFVDPQPEQIYLGDIAHGLSMTCRFSGHCRIFYSVAEHCIRVAQLVPAEDRLAALLHDAAEAYMTDIPRPLKRLLPDYRSFEQIMLGAILKKFGLSPELPASVHTADGIMLATEGRDLCAPGWEYWGLPHKPLSEVMGRILSPRLARIAWMSEVDACLRTQ